MFGFFAAILVLALLSYGSVLPHSYLFTAMLWSIAPLGLLLWDLKNRRNVTWALPVYVIVTAAFLVLDVKLALGVFAIGWGWLAAQKYPNNIAWFFRFLLIVGVLEAILGLVQYFFAPGWIFGYHNVYYKSSGTLINRNHFAGLLEMILPAALGFAYVSFKRDRDPARTYMFLFVGALIFLAVIFSTSRMGMFSALLTTLFLAALLRLRESSAWVSVLAFGIIGLVLSGALWIGTDVVFQRFAELGGEDVLAREGRSVIYADTIKLVSERPWGIGLGNYVDVFRQYQTYRPHLLMDHAHNDYLETAAEWGVIPAALFWLATFAVVFRTLRRFVQTASIEKAGILMSCIGALFSIQLHSLTDFNLQIPSNAMLFCFVLGLAVEVSRPGTYKKMATSNNTPY